MAEDKKKVILVIEDEEVLLDSYCEMIQDAGYECLKAGDGYKGLDALETSHDTINLVLLDLMMPGIDGLEVLHTINDNKAKYGSIPVIILTNMTSEKVIKEAFDNGAVAYLIKTELNYDDLINEIKKVIG